jgi:hypothetical protein
VPQVFKIGSYWVYFWLDENIPLEPIHVHVAQGRPNPNGTKIWITKNHRCSLAHNKSKIPLVTPAEPFRSEKNERRNEAQAEGCIAQPAPGRQAPYSDGLR